MPRRAALKFVQTYGTTAKAWLDLRLKERKKPKEMMMNYELGLRGGFLIYDF